MIRTLGVLLALVSATVTAAAPPPDSAAKIARDFAALSGRSGFAVIRLADGKPQKLVWADHADEQFAIGSIFKLWVLDALVEEIASGRRRWNEVVPLGSPSLPSGITQDWPAGSAVTIETLATLMISLSDNTATDTLIRLIGRERIATRVRASGHAQPSRMLPLLTTAESFALKLSPAATREVYARADDAAQTDMLAALDAPVVLARAETTALDAAPTAIDSIEWFASPQDVGRILDALRRRSDPKVLQVLGVAPELPTDLRQRFAIVGYKGGSEVGVIALAWLVRSRSGDWTVVTASWNDPHVAVDNARFERLAQRLVWLVAQGS